MFFAVCPYVCRRIRQCVANPFEYPDQCSPSSQRAPLPESNESLRRGPLICAVKRQSHSVLRNVGRSCDQVVYRSKVCLSLNVVVNNPEILQVSVPIANRAVQSNQSKEL